ncbi:hypothetical protein [Sporolactobacillus sp. THM19-2]|uniref:hypothetical protein n=1 Tax=Sporolactobacillus sp. THM19-2 TaxID=2511171 RepID=UPI00101E9FAD|nr:hypothetical protein [Sporolactobacillus sp. THM19-2]RYL89247.1 hypothetical protein EWH91_10820 [Sporolactobacillus sp. THM19-2]
MKREGIGQDQYQKYQDFFQAMTTVALNNVRSDISTLEQISKPEVITDTENGKDGPALLKSIGDIQNEIGNQNNGLANNANITKFDLDLSKIDDDADFSEESLFIDTDPNKNYRESELRSYQLLLMNTKNSLSNLLKMVTTFQPVQPVYSDLIQPDDPALSAPEDMELTEPERPDSVELGGAFDQTGSWMEQVTGQLISSLYGLDGINKEAQTVDQRETMNDTEKSIQGQYDHAIKQYNDALDIQKAELEKAQNVLLNNMSHMQQQVENVAKPLVLTEPDPTFKDVDKGFVLSFKSNTFNELNTIEEGIQSIADSQSAILKSSQDVRSLVNGVQSDANQLSGNWGQNVEATAQLGHAIARTLGNTGEPGNRNPSAYQQLVSPVNLAGLQPGGPNNIAEAEHDDPADTSTDAAPTEQPFLTLLAVLVASILIGYFSYHYRNLSRILNAVISSLLALVSSAAIVAYGITQYGLEGSGVIMWSFFTLGLIAVISVWVREAWQISDMVGVLLITGLIVYFTLPLLKNSLERFAYQNPAADVYLSIAYGEASFLFLEGMVALAVLMIPALAVIGIREVIHHIKEEKAHESETL